MTIIDPMVAGAAQMLANRASFSEEQIRNAEMTLDQLGIDPSMLDESRLSMLAMGDPKGLEGLMGPGDAAIAEAAQNIEAAAQASAPAAAASLWEDPPAQTKNVATARENADQTVQSQELMDLQSVQQRQEEAGRRTEITDQQLETLKMNIENKIKTAQMDPNFSQKDAELLAQTMAAGTSLAPNLAAEMGSEAFRQTQSLDDHMNTAADGSKVEQDQEKGGLFDGMFAKIAGLGAVIAGAAKWMLPGSQNDVQDMSLASLGDLTPNVQGVGTQSIGMNGPGSGPMLG